jgi:site-specific DNA-methyltransferase (adenine-specific)
MLALVADFTNIGDTVLDPFMGSATTGIACLRLGRKFIGIEKDQHNFDVACRRIRKAHPEMFELTAPYQETLL